MKTVIYLIFTSFISTGAFMAALNMKQPLPAFIIAFGVWAWFGWGCNRRAKKKADRRLKEQVFQNYMRNQSVQRANR